MGFVQECINNSLPVWESCLETPFLKGIVNGTLPEDCFKGYIVDDSLYLREYTKVFAWGILHAKDMEEIRTYYSLLSFVNEAENSTRLYYLSRYQLEDKAIQNLPLRPENKAYVETMINAAKEGSGSAECMMACLPCMLSYGWIFDRLRKEHPQSEQTIYGRFVCDYGGEAYDSLCKQWIDFAEKACQELTDIEKQRCMNIFYNCSVHELKFWQMSGNPRTDI